MSSERLGRRLLSGKQTVFSIRDTGYKSTDYAIAELIDNSVQANASTILIILITDPKTGGKRAVDNVSEIVVVDDGDGMNDQLLFDCLAFGESGRFDDRSGIGRFGMGLSQASVSQGKRVDVWSFQKTQPVESGHVHIDLAEIENSQKSELEILPPTYRGDEQHNDLPEWVDELYSSYGMRTQRLDGVDVRSGTTVRWTNLDRLRWVRAGAIHKHTELTLGRVYRRFLQAGLSNRHIDLKLAVIKRTELSSGGAPSLDFKPIRPTDPLFLMRPDECTLEYWERAATDGDTSGAKVQVKHVPMFRPYPTGGPGQLPDASLDDPSTLTIPADAQEFEVLARPDAANSSLKGKKFKVRVSCSLARADAQPGRNPGKDTHQGRQARDHAGVSIVRADRELCIETTLASEATDRWWGIEVSFGAELDEVFGVTNNKQDVPYFSQALRMCREFPNMTVDNAIQEGLFDEEHPIHDLWQIAQHVLRRRNEMKDARRENKNTSDRREKKQPGVVAGISRQKANRPDILPPSKSAKEFEAAYPSSEEQADAIRSELRQKHGDHLTSEQIDAIVQLRDADFIVQVHEKHVPESDALFWPEPFGNLEIAWINTAHPGHHRLLTPLRLTDDRINSLEEAQLRKLAAVGADAVGMLILMWCMMEIDDPDGRHTYKQARERWGSEIKNILSKTDISIGDDLLATLDDESDDTNE